MSGSGEMRIARIRADEVRVGDRVSYCGVYHDCFEVEERPDDRVRIHMRGTPPMLSELWREQFAHETVLTIVELEVDAHQGGRGRP